VVADGGIAAGGGVSAGGACVSPSVAGGGIVVSSSPAGACVSPSVAGGGIVAQLPLASGVEPSGHNCAYEGCSIDDDCTVRIAAVTRITPIIIDILLYIVSYANVFFIRDSTFFSPILTHSLISNKIYMCKDYFLKEMMNFGV
jgi:hypothetical protein